ncbi:hypothetical protein ES703_105427 [subsurface metagenome]
MPDEDRAKWLSPYDFKRLSQELGIQGNRDAWTGDEFTVTPGTAEQLPDVDVPDGFEAVVRGHPDNTGFIYIGTTQAQAQAHTIPLGPDDSYSLRVSNLNLIWCDIQVAGEKGIYTVEQ